MQMRGPGWWPAPGCLASVPKGRRRTCTRWQNPEWYWSQHCDLNACLRDGPVADCRCPHAVPGAGCDLLDAAEGLALDANSWQRGPLGRSLSGGSFLGVVRGRWRCCTSMLYRSGRVAEAGLGCPLPLGDLSWLMVKAMIFGGSVQSPGSRRSYSRGLGWPSRICTDEGHQILEFMNFRS